MNRSNTLSDILSNIHQNKTNEFFKMKIGQLNFNNNKKAIIHKQESSQEIISLFFNIKQNNNNNYDTFEEKSIIFIFPFVLFKPIDSINMYKNKMFIFYYSPIYISNGDSSISKIDYTEKEFNNMSV